MISNAAKLWQGDRIWVRFDATEIQLNAALFAEPSRGRRSAAVQNWSKN